MTMKNKEEIDPNIEHFAELIQDPSYKKVFKDILSIHDKYEENIKKQKINSVLSKPHRKPSKEFVQICKEDLLIINKYIVNPKSNDNSTESVELNNLETICKFILMIICVMIVWIV